MTYKEEATRELARDIAFDLCLGQGQLLYLTYYGSRLFGTSTPESDVDVYGVFLPHSWNCLLGKERHHISSKVDGIDLQLFSVQKWLGNMVMTGEANGIDLLFSHTSLSTIIYRNTKFWPEFSKIFANTDSLVSRVPLDEMKIVGFARSQAAKYGFKGTRLKVLTDVLKFLEENRLPLEKKGHWKSYRLSHIMSHLVAIVDNQELCSISRDFQNMLYLNGKLHDGHISIGEFYERVRFDAEKYGERSRNAMKNVGVDWKALSHTLRCIYEAMELLKTGQIKFPLAQANTIRSVKEGKLDFPDVQDLIEMGFANLVEVDKESTYGGFWDQPLADQLIMNLYNLKGDSDEI